MSPLKRRLRTSGVFNLARRGANVSEVIGWPKRCRLATVSGRSLSTGLDLFADAPSKG